MKNLIIVCEKSTKKFGDYLSQLVSMDDDTDDAVVGVKDGSVATQVWLETENYQSNAQTTSSEQYILFIGNSKGLKAKREFMNIDFSEYGMKYGSLGKQAFIAVDEVVKHKEYHNFYDYAKNYAKNLDEVLKPKKATGVKTAAGLGVGATVAKASASALAAKGAVLGAATVGGAAALAMLGPAIIAVPIGLRMITDNKIKNQMYTCAVMKFYLDYLSEFLGL